MSSYVSQEQIDFAACTGSETVPIDPAGGGVDPFAIVTVVSKITEGVTSLVQWKPSDETPDATPTSGPDTNGAHIVGIQHSENERFAFIECTEPGSYSLQISSFSDISDEVVVRRVWCAALRPTSENFTFSNPIKDIAVTASPLTLNVQTVALDEYKTIKQTDTVTINHTQSFPCVFGFCYIHKFKGEVEAPVPTPEPQPQAVIRQRSFSFQAPNEINYLERTFDAGGRFMSIGGVAVRSGWILITDMTLKSKDTGIRCYRLRIMEKSGMHNLTHDVILPEDYFIIGGSQSIYDLLLEKYLLAEFSDTVTIQATLPECVHDVVLTITYEVKNV